MTPQEFINEYRYDRRLITGGFFSMDPIPVISGDRVGIVLMHAGGPSDRGDIHRYMYRVLMDPVLIDLPLGRTFRHTLSRLMAPFLAKAAQREYGAIGGHALVNKLRNEQARTLEKELNCSFGHQCRVTFKTYVAARYGHPFAGEVGRRIAEDGINKVVLLPLYPHYSKAYSGSSFLYWWMSQIHREVPNLPTSYVFEYAAHPKYIQALSDRIDQALQRFPRHLRDRVHLVFSAQGTPLRDMSEHQDPYCCLVHSTVERVMALRNEDHPFHVSFQNAFGWMEWLDPGTSELLEALAKKKHEAVLVVPISHTADCMETVYRLDVRLREETEEMGIAHYEVASGLNCHPLFIETLAEVAVSQLSLEGKSLFAAIHGDGISPYPLCPINERGHFKPEDRTERCVSCPVLVEAGKWPTTYPGDSPSLRP